MGAAEKVDLGVLQQTSTNGDVGGEESVIGDAIRRIPRGRHEQAWRKATIRIGRVHEEEARIENLAGGQWLALIGLEEEQISFVGLQGRGRGGTCGSGKVTQTQPRPLNPT